MTKQEFARRLYAKMLSKRLIQSDLARMTGLSRNNISTYMRGQCYPTHRSLELLAQALECPVNELLPNLEATIRSEAQSSVSFKTSVADPTRGWLVISRLVSTPVGIEILKLLDNDIFE